LIPTCTESESIIQTATKHRNEPLPTIVTKRASEPQARIVTVKKSESHIKIVPLCPHEQRPSFSTLRDWGILLTTHRQAVRIEG